MTKSLTHLSTFFRSANAVGLMRNGRILAEGPPDRLMEKFNQCSLEDVFLHLCMKDDKFAGSMVRTTNFAVGFAYSSRE